MLNFVQYIRTGEPKHFIVKLDGVEMGRVKRIDKRRWVFTPQGKDTATIERSNLVAMEKALRR